MSCLAGLSMALLKRLSNSHSLSGFDPDSAQKPHWTSLSLGLSSESTSPNLLWSASLPSPTAVMHHPSNPQWNAPSPETSPLFSSLLFSSVFYLQRLLIYFHSNLPNLWLWLSKFRLATDYCEMPFRKHSHQRVFLSSGLCTKVVCVEAVRRAPALIRHKWRKEKNHSALLRWAVEPLSCIWLFISVFPLGLRAVHLSKKRHCKS